MSELKDKVLVCKDCKHKFTFTVEQQKNFGQRGWADPVRCKVCQNMKKILRRSLEDGVPINAQIKFSEVCDKCGRKFFTVIKRKQGMNLYCDDCWLEIKRADLKHG